MKSISDQISQSRIPYPQRRQLALEIAADLEMVDDNLLLESGDLNELEEIHSTWISKALKRLSIQEKHVESAIAFIPLILVSTITTKEKVMMNFIREGGFGMYAIFAVGLFLIARELRHSFRLLILKDHSTENLRLDTQNVLLGGLALMLMGIGWSALGVYVSANAALANNASAEIMLIGAKESITPFILSTLLTALVVLAHYSTRRVMRIWFAPIES